LYVVQKYGIFRGMVERKTGGKMEDWFIEVVQE